jgi:hypothetical protein
LATGEAKENRGNIRDGITNEEEGDKGSRGDLGDKGSRETREKRHRRK